MRLVQSKRNLKEFMKQIGLICLALTGFSLSAAQPLAQQQFDIPKPTPKWFGERIALPPKGFAPDLGLKGIEEILFAPGMFKSDQPDFFTYVFLFAVEAKPVLTSEVLQKELFTITQASPRRVCVTRIWTLASSR